MRFKGAEAPPCVKCGKPAHYHFVKDDIYCEHCYREVREIYNEKLRKDFHYA